ncbi:hypothetical protein AXG93_862s1090 [Marchantia polymorpha subsp. ruderalis]|uniref:Uncharacterized protein n=1 Tax=Marchantia polymorpha subsp. ruderalis TaxID=1480154 RepID=A0A176WJ17_MARPO|nr:hypothetical protein AXG93_862s1090 [Marchantia polymorpha subsp. ruderalis]
MALEEHMDDSQSLIQTPLFLSHRMSSFESNPVIVDKANTGQVSLVLPKAVVGSAEVGDWQLRPGTYFDDISGFDSKGDIGCDRKSGVWSRFCLTAMCYSKAMTTPHVRFVFGPGHHHRAGGTSLDLGRIVSHREPHTDELLRHIVINFVIASQDAIGVTTTWLVYELSMHSDASHRLYLELREYECQRPFGCQNLENEYRDVDLQNEDYLGMMDTRIREFSVLLTSESLD